MDDKETDDDGNDDKDFMDKRARMYDDSGMNGEDKDRILEEKDRILKKKIEYLMKKTKTECLRTIWEIELRRRTIW